MYVVSLKRYQSIRDENALTVGFRIKISSLHLGTTFLRAGYSPV